MRNHAPHLLCITLIAVMIGGCGMINVRHGSPAAVTPRNPSAVSPRTSKEHIERARHLEQQGDLHRAIVEWRILEALEPRDIYYPLQVQRLQDTIEQRVAIHLDQGNKALQSRNLKAATLEFLKALALDPKRPEPRAALRELEQTRATTVELAKLRRMEQRAVTMKAAGASTLEQTQDLFYLELSDDHFAKGDPEAGIRELQKYLASNPQDQGAKKRLADARRSLAQRFERDGDLEAALHYYDAYEKPIGDAKAKQHVDELRRQLADRYYKQGLKVFRSDLQKAIELWELAVKNNPAHTEARMKLKSAYQMQKNLHGIVESGR